MDGSPRRDSRSCDGAYLAHEHLDRLRRLGKILRLHVFRIGPGWRLAGRRTDHGATRRGDLDAVKLPLLPERNLIGKPAIGVDPPAPYPGKVDISVLLADTQVNRRKRQESPHTAGHPLREQEILLRNISARRAHPLVKLKPDFLGPEACRTDGLIEQNKIGACRRTGPHGVIRPELSAQQP